MEDEATKRQRFWPCSCLIKEALVVKKIRKRLSALRDKRLLDRFQDAPCNTDKANCTGFQTGPNDVLQIMYSPPER